MCESLRLAKPSSESSSIYHRQAFGHAFMTCILDNPHIKCFMKELLSTNAAHMHLNSTILP